MAVLCNIPMGFPSALSFGKYHSDHHNYLGEEGRDPDLPMRLESQSSLFVPFKFFFWSVLSLFYAFRPLFCYNRGLSLNRTSPSCHPRAGRALRIRVGTLDLRLLRGLEHPQPKPRLSHRASRLPHVPLVQPAQSQGSCSRILRELAEPHFLHQGAHQVPLRQQFQSLQQDHSSQ